MSQTRHLDKSSDKNLNEMEINNLPKKESEVRVIRMLTELRRRMDEYGKSFNQEIQNIRRYQIEVTELKDTVTELKSTQGSTSD